MGAAIGFYVMGIDPSLRNTGWVIAKLFPGECDRVVIVDFGLVETERDTKKSNTLVSTDESRRIVEIVVGLDAAFSAWLPIAICSETLSGSRGAAAARALGISWGIVNTFAWLKGKPLLTTTPQALKKAVTNQRAASKQAVEEHVLRLVQFAPTAQEKLDDWTARRHGKLEHVYDACAVVWTLRNDKSFLMLGAFANQV